MTETHTNDPAALLNDPLAGCEDLGVARQRASDLMGPWDRPGDAIATYWYAQSVLLLGTLMNAAASDRRNRSIWDVACWVHDPDANEREIRAAARQAGYLTDAYAGQFLATNARTRDSLCATILEAVFAS